MLSRGVRPVWVLCVSSSSLPLYGTACQNDLGHSGVESLGPVDWQAVFGEFQKNCEIFRRQARLEFVADFRGVSVVSRSVFNFRLKVPLGN